MIANGGGKAMQLVKGHEAAIIQLAQKNGFDHPKIGSLASLGIAVDGVDFILLVSRVSSSIGLFELVQLEDELTHLLGVHIDVCTEKMIPEHDRPKVLKSLIEIIA
jgi:predicted nucleotidyltransferase